jgi:hypothetical protein
MHVVQLAFAAARSAFEPSGKVTGAIAFDPDEFWAGEPQETVNKTATKNKIRAYRISFKTYVKYIAFAHAVSNGKAHNPIADRTVLTIPP